MILESSPASFHRGLVMLRNSLSTLGFTASGSLSTLRIDDLPDVAVFFTDAVFRTGAAFRASAAFRTGAAPPDLAELDLGGEGEAC
mmetsp:Transcript_7649/g.17575  ORF Transcript_7649/g.17575 Transcript_7649/m.17575 type:complete len:86 (+) Transcript_7649:2308-2565(+)